MAEQADVYRAAFLKALAPESPMTVSAWSDSFRYLSQKASAEPGRYRTERTEYLREIMDCLSPSSPVQEIVFMKSAQVGGPLALDTPIPTPAGWKMMSELAAGDFVFDESGRPCRVVGVSEVFEDRPCFEIEFSDGSVIRCDHEHRWRAWDDAGAGAARQRLVTRTTFELLQDYKKGKRNRYAIDVAAPLDLPAVDLPIAPYALGVWLGDGHAISSQVTTFSEDAQEMADYIAVDGHPTVVKAAGKNNGRALVIHIEPTPEYDLCKRGHSYAEQGRTKRGACRECMRQHVKAWRKRKGLPTSFEEMDPVVAERPPLFGAKLEALGILGKKAIPMAFLRASAPQRLALLQGLMDTDGSIEPRSRRCEFSTTCDEIAEGVGDLLSGLGIKYSLYSKTIEKGFHGGARQSAPSLLRRFSFIVYEDKPVFRLARKRSLIPSREGRRTSETERRRIVDMRRVPSFPVKCIEVDSADHLFLAGKTMIPTHNSEAGFNWLGYIMDRCPGPTMMIQPTVEAAEKVSRQRIAPMIEDCPVLKGKLRDKARDGSNTLLVKEFPGGFLIMTGANSGAGLRSMPAKFIFMDEIDAYPADVDGEGNPVALAEKRAQTFARRKVFKNSTPTYKGASNIEAAYEASDRRRYHVPCPHCGEFQWLRWRQVKWDRLPNGHPDFDSVRYECEHCKTPVPEHQKTEMLRRGRWVAENPGSPVAGFHINALYSPLGWFSWRDAVREWTNAQKDQNKLKVFINTVLGETYEVKAEDTPKWREIYGRREAYQIGVVPRRAVLLTGACDVQKDRLEVMLVGWNRKEAWVVTHEVIQGDTSRPIHDPGGPWPRLSELIAKIWPHESGAGLSVNRFAVDSGYNTVRVYEFVRSQNTLQVIPIKGQEDLAQPINTPRAVEIRQGGKRVKRGVRLWSVGVNILKAEVYGRLKLERPTDEELAASGGRWPATYVHFPMLEEEFFRQLTAEKLVLVTTRTGHPRYQWVKDHPANEALDLMVYNFAAHWAAGAPRWPEDHWAQLEAQFSGGGAPAVPAAPPPGAAAVAAPREPEPPPPAPPPRRRSSFWDR